MPPRSETFPGGVVRLSKLLSQLNASPKLVLHGVTSLRLSFSAQTDHIGARHFVKEELPRIRWVNPNLRIDVEKVRKTPEEKWRPEMEVELEDGTVRKVDMHDKYSTTITKELMDLAGGVEWERHSFTNRNAGLPVLPGADVHEAEERNRELAKKAAGKTESAKLPTLQEYLKANPQKAAEKPKKITKSTTSSTTPAKKPEKNTI